VLGTGGGFAKVTHRMSRLPLSISIISLNEEANLHRCLASVRDLAQEMVIVDSGSKDSTAVIAAEFGAKFVHQDWLGYTAQKNHCLALCSQPWILALDCDEELTPELRDAIHAFFANGDDQKFDGAWMSRLVWFMGRWIRHGDWYPDRKVRLFRRDKSRWAADGGGQVHERLDVDGPCTTLRGDLLHYSFKSIQHHLVKHAQYSGVFLQTQQGKGKRWSLLHTLFRPWWRFVRAYVLKRGFLDGFPGFWIAAATAFFTFDRYSRMYEVGAEEKTKGGA
jgi:glycosyltransferase involved in cell wall biosynthesis